MLPLTTLFQNLSVRNLAFLVDLAGVQPLPDRFRGQLPKALLRLLNAVILFIALRHGTAPNLIYTGDLSA
jgi:hypothetical protein